MPLVLADEDRATARRLQRLAEQGQLRRIHPGIYTDDLVQPIETIVRREFYVLCARIAPGSVISHRSALEGKPTPGGNYYLTGTYRRDIRLPGTTLRIGEGPGPLDSDIKIPCMDSLCQVIIDIFSVVLLIELAERADTGCSRVFVLWRGAGNRAPWTS